MNASHHVAGRTPFARDQRTFHAVAHSSDTGAGERRTTVLGTARTACYLPPMTFQIGQRVVYPPQGAGIVEATTTRNVMGETKAYLKVAFLRGDMDMLVPIDREREVGLREAIGVDETERLLQAVGRADLSLPNAWPPRHRAEQEILARGDAYTLARLIGTLDVRDLEKGLASTERDILDHAKSLLASELAVVHDLSIEEAGRWIDEALPSHRPGALRRARATFGDEGDAM